MHRLPKRICMHVPWHRSIPRIAACFVALFGIMGYASAEASATAPAAAATTAYEQGQAYERLFQDIDLAPGTCGIVLERPQCASDLETIAGMRGSDPTDARVRKWFASGDISLRVKNWNDTYVPDKAWIDDPGFAWWYTAGVASIAASLPQGPNMAEYVGSIVDVLAKHASAAPSDSSSWVLSGGTPYARLASIQEQLQQTFPVVAYPAAVFAASPTSYAQLGVYLATVEELVDSPSAFSRPESRAFAAVALAKLQSLHESFADGLTVAPMQAEINEPFMVDRSWLNTTWRKSLTSQTLNTTWPKEPRDALVMGGMIAQVAYNAAVLKDSTADADFRSVISKLPAWPSMSAKTHADIAALQNIPYAANGGTWTAINKAATTATKDIASNI